MTPLYLDNDVISKLASCDLLDEAIESLGSEKASVHILGTFKHRFGITNAGRRSRIESEVGKETFQRILSFQQSVAEIPAARNEMLLMFEDVPAVDCDTALRAIFGMGLDAEEENVMRALDSNIEHLRAISGNLLQ